MHFYRLKKAWNLNPRLILDDSEETKNRNDLKNETKLLEETIQVLKKFNNQHVDNQFIDDPVYFH